MCASASQPTCNAPARNAITVCRVATCDADAEAVGGALHEVAAFALSPRLHCCCPPPPAAPWLHAGSASHWGSPDGLQALQCLLQTQHAHSGNACHPLTAQAWPPQLLVLTARCIWSTLQPCEEDVECVAAACEGAALVAAEALAHADPEPTLAALAWLLDCVAACGLALDACGSAPLCDAAGSVLRAVTAICRAGRAHCLLCSDGRPGRFVSWALSAASADTLARALPLMLAADVIPTDASSPTAACCCVELCSSASVALVDAALDLCQQHAREATLVHGQCWSLLCGISHHAGATLARAWLAALACRRVVAARGRARVLQVPTSWTACTCAEARVRYAPCRSSPFVGAWVWVAADHPTAPAPLRCAAHQCWLKRFAGRT